MLLAGEFTAAALAWDVIALDGRDFAAVRFAHDVYLHIGDAESRLASSSRAVKAWECEPGWGFVAGQHAFALEEVGRYDEAEELGQLALGLDPDDLWARHALAHVYESTDDTPAALEMLEGSVERWSGQDLFAIHIWWHLALRLLASRDLAGALAVFDERQPHASSAFQLCDQTSLLWRLELAGCDAGDRWDALADRWDQVVERHTCGFLDVHAALAFARRPGHPGARRWFEGLSARPSGPSENDTTFSKVVRPSAEAFRGYTRGGTDRFVRLVDELGPSTAASAAASPSGTSPGAAPSSTAAPIAPGRRWRPAVTWALTGEQLAIQAEARALAREVIAPRAADIDRSEQYPFHNVAAMQQAGFTGMTVPAELGGPGRSLLDAVLVVEEMAKVCGVTGRIAVECNMGALSAVMAYGTDAQRKRVAELVLAGDKPAICITEPGAGSAASEMTTRADRRGDVYLLNGTKHWITGGERVENAPRVRPGPMRTATWRASPPSWCSGTRRRGWRSAAVSRPWVFGAFLRRSSTSTTWRSAPTWPWRRPRVCGGGSAT